MNTIMITAPVEMFDAFRFGDWVVLSLGTGYLTLSGQRPLALLEEVEKRLAGGVDASCKARADGFTVGRTERRRRSYRSQAAGTCIPWQ